MDISPASASASAPVVSETGSADAVPAVSSAGATVPVLETPPAPSKDWLDSVKAHLENPLMLVSLTALSYFTVYWFKLGTFAGFGISERFVRIEFSDTLNVGVTLSLYLALPLMMLVLARWVHAETSHFKWPIRMTVVILTVLAATYFVGMRGSYHYLEISYYIVALCLFVPGFIVVTWVGALIGVLAFGRRERSIRQATVDMFDAAVSGDLYQGSLTGFLRPKYLILLIAAIFSGIVFLRLGRMSAQNETTFTNIENTPYVVIDTLNDRLLCKSLNEERDGLLPGFTLVPMKDGEAVSFVSVKLNKKDENTAAPAAVPEPASPAAAAAPPADPAATAAPAPSAAAP